MNDTFENCYAVIFFAILTEDLSGYSEASEESHQLVAINGTGITIPV